VGFPHSRAHHHHFSLGKSNSHLPTLHQPLCPAAKCSSYGIMPTHWLPHHSQETRASCLTFHCVLVPPAFNDISYSLHTLSRGLALSPCLRSSLPSPPSGVHQLVFYTIFQRLHLQRSLRDLRKTFCGLTLMQLYISLCDKCKILEPENSDLNTVYATH